MFFPHFLLYFESSHLMLFETNVHFIFLCNSNLPDLQDDSCNECIQKMSFKQMVYLYTFVYKSVTPSILELLQRALVV